MLKQLHFTKQLKQEKQKEKLQEIIKLLKNIKTVLETQATNYLHNFLLGFTKKSQIVFWQVFQL